MSSDVAAWLRSAGIIAEAAPALKGQLTYEETVRLWGHVNINNSIILAYTGISAGTSILSTAIGRYCSIGQNCSIGLSSHPLDRLTTSTLTYKNAFLVEGEYKAQIFDKIQKRTQIDHDVWIGANTIVLPGVHIGTGSVIGAGSVVTKNVAPYTIVAGNPATKKRSRFDDAAVNILLTSEWWRYDLIEAMKRGTVNDWADPISAIQNLEEGFAQGDITKIDVNGRKLWAEGEQYNRARLDHKIFV